MKSMIDNDLTTTAPQDIGLQDAASFDVYRKLKEDIVTCALKPDEKLRFDGLRKNYGVGIGTLREALSHLVSDGLVRTEVGRGFRVAPVSVKDLNDVTEWRVEFEVRAIQESILKGDETWEANIVSAFHLLSINGLPDHDASHEVWQEYRTKHERFHNALVAGCGSPWLLYFRNILRGQARRYQALSVHLQLLKKPTSYRDDKDHQKIMTAVVSRNEKEACKLIESHIRRTSEVVENDLDEFLALISNGSDPIKPKGSGLIMAKTPKK